MYGHNHAFFDPNVWYAEDELRKQVELFAGCIILTGQEAPETHKKMREDLFKKTMSADGIAGRKPYGITTRSSGNPLGRQSCCLLHMCVHVL